MTRVHVFCEGQTESSFVKKVLIPHFMGMNIQMIAMLFRTGPKGRGGITSYQRMKRQIITQCKKDQSAKVTVLWDLYPLPKDFPFRNTVKGEPDQKADAVKRALRHDIDQPNFIPNIVVHEFEGLLFSDPVAFNILGTDKQNKKAVEKLMAIRNRFPTPEHINEGSETAPSKQIIKSLVEYAKVRDGIQIALKIGLNTIRQECPLFDIWIREIEDLSKN